MVSPWSATVGVEKVDLANTRLNNEPFAKLGILLEIKA